MAKKDFKGWIAKADRTYHLEGETKKIKKGQTISDFEQKYMSDYAVECWFVAPDSKEGKAILAVQELEAEKNLPKGKNKNKTVEETTETPKE